ncbi:hypothetical protein [Methylobacterium sp. CM6247]
MDQVTQKLLEALRDAIQVYSDAADEFALMAELAEREGLEGHAAAIRLIARSQRVKALEFQGQLAGARVEYGAI